MELIDNAKGNYRFLTGVAPYSSGVIAMPGYEVVHAILLRPIPYRQGFDRVEQHLNELGRPRQALCAMELRSPTPFTFAGFDNFNQGYQDILADWDIPVNGKNPVARTNVAPEVGAPPEPALYAFSYTVPSDDAGPLTFVVAGAGELSGGDIVRAGETSADAIREKAAHVMGIMQARLSGLQAQWSEITTVDIYTVHPLQSILSPTILAQMNEAVIRGVHWFYSRPPIIGLEYEMDMRGVRQEIRLS